MKRSWNPLVWAGFGVILLGLLTYLPVFVRFPLTRDVPWMNLLVFCVGASLLAAGIKRAFTEPDRYRGKITGVVFAALSLLALADFSYAAFYYARKLPSAAAALKVGQPAPDFTLPSTDSSPVTLSELLKRNRAVLLIFYRGYW